MIFEVEHFGNGWAKMDGINANLIKYDCHTLDTPVDFAFSPRLRLAIRWPNPRVVFFTRSTVITATSLTPILTLAKNSNLNSKNLWQNFNKILKWQMNLRSTKAQQKPKSSHEPCDTLMDNTSAVEHNRRKRLRWPSSKYIVGPCITSKNKLAVHAAPLS